MRCSCGNSCLGLRYFALKNSLQDFQVYFLKNLLFVWLLQNILLKKCLFSILGKKNSSSVKKFSSFFTYYKRFLAFHRFIFLKKWVFFTKFSFSPIIHICYHKTIFFSLKNSKNFKFPSNLTTFYYFF